MTPLTASRSTWLSFVPALALFVLPVLYFGLLSFKILAIDYLWRVHEAQEWTRTDASIVDVNWIRFKARSIDAGRLAPDMRIKVSYRYVYGNTSYLSHDVGFEAFAERNRHLYLSLDEAYSRKKLVTVWVNPNHPAHSVLDREYSWLAISYYLALSVFLTVFGGWMLYRLGKARRG